MNLVVRRSRLRSSFPRDSCQSVSETIAAFHREINQRTHTHTLGQSEGRVDGESSNRGTNDEDYRQRRALYRCPLRTCLSPSPCSFHIIWFHVLAASNPSKTIYPPPKCTKRLRHTCMQNLACSAWLDCLVLTRNLIPPPAHCDFVSGHGTFASSTWSSPWVLAAAVYYCYLPPNLCTLAWTKIDSVTKSALRCQLNVHNGFPLNWITFKTTTILWVVWKTFSKHCKKRTCSCAITVGLCI